MQKPFGKLTEDQFRRVMATLPDVRKGTKELPQLLRKASAEQIQEALAEGIYWAAFYELPFTQHVALGLYLLGLKDWLRQIASVTDPQEALLQALHRKDDEIDQEPDGKELTLASVLSVLVSFQRSMLSVMLYKRSMSALVEEVRGGNDDAFFDAVRIDRSVLACPTFVARLSKAEAFQEKHFFDRLRRAIKGPSKKHWEAYQDLRYSLMILREMGFDSMSDAELEHILVDVLKVYPKTWSARKNLRKQYYEAKKINSP